MTAEIIAEKAKSEKKKCDSLLQRSARDIFLEEQAAAAADKKKSKKQSCYKEARKLKTQCSQLARCCSISKLCRDTSAIDQKIREKREQIRKSLRKCKKEKRRRKKDRKHHGGKKDQFASTLEMHLI
ncbi:unnamed protein product [Enterobius vermicularis]|uniref:Uncharacterized protein n=1 Tax=Enterobius vermicularis TaxID=51028 RepID=A0A0N4UZ21_ENTVE|nr:unnamed protein product [Enterobius vermicularis]